MRALLVLGVVAGAGCGRVGFDGVDREDATGPGDGVSAPFCATRPTPPLFCDDFEGADAWTAQSMSNGAWTVDAGTLLVTTNAIGGTSAKVEKNVVLTADVRRVRMAFDVRAEIVDASDPVLAVFRFDDGVSTRHDIEYVYKAPPEQAFIEDVAVPYNGAPTYNFFRFTAPSAGDWHRVEVAIDLDAPLLTSTLDGVEVLSMAPAVTTGGTLTMFVIGVPFVRGPANPWRFRFDNVVLETFRGATAIPPPRSAPR